MIFQTSLVYCTKCKTKTETKDIKTLVGKNEKPYQKGKCRICNTNKISFLVSTKDSKTNTNKQPPVINVLENKVAGDLISLSAELHKPARRNYIRRKTLVYGIDDLWQVDLVEMDTGDIKGISKINKGIKYLLTIIETSPSVSTSRK